MTAQNYEKPGLSQARAFCILRTSPLPIGKWATSNLILVQQKRRSKSKDKRDASGKLGWHPFSNRRTKMEGWTFTSCVSSLCHFSTYNLHTSVKKGFIFMERAHFNKHGLSYYVISF